MQKLRNPQQREWINRSCQYQILYWLNPVQYSLDFLDMSLWEREQFLNYFKHTNGKIDSQ